MNCCFSVVCPVFSHLLNGFYRVAVTRMARKSRRLQLQRWRRGTNRTPATVSRSFLCNVRVSCMSAREAIAFPPKRRKNKPFCHAWCDLKDSFWNVSLTAKRFEKCPSECVFFFLFSFFCPPDVAPCVLCNFLLAIAHCANTHLRCMTLLLARQSKINHVKISFKP